MIDITDKHNCSGCYACVNKCPKGCISMQEDDEGFFYPQVDRSLCTGCGVCDKACPIIESTIAERSSDVYACKNKNEKIRLASSAGGVFTLLAEHVLSKDGIVFGAMFDIDFNVVHGYGESKEELYKFRGSKYVQSLIGDAYKTAEEFLKQGKLVLFSGTPCQIAGLKIFLKKEYYNLISIDIVCHGVPSPKVFRKYLELLKNQYQGELENIEFRNKQNGWENYNISMQFSNNQQFLQRGVDNNYMKGFLKEIFLRPSCYHCQFKKNNSGSDITLADYWGVQTKFPEFDDDKGVSLVLVNSNKGRDVFLQSSYQMEVVQSDIEHAIQYNPCIIKSVTAHPKRKQFFEKLDMTNLDKLIKKYCGDSFSITLKRKLKKSCMQIFGNE